MMQFSISLLRPSLNTVTRLFLVSALSTVGLVVSYAPQSMLRSTTWSLGDAAYAQANPPQVSQYARAAFYIEQQRQQDYAEAKKLMSGNVPEDVCRQQNIPSAVHDICGRFLKRSAEIIKENGLTISQFNDITRRKEGDPSLQQQIQSELLKLQKTTP
ncbi:DUF4168 domain-containing protein [Stenomitos frigidus]|nr:DUF4168 domain-containing protein [Stenomitos frigidus]